MVFAVRFAPEKRAVRPSAPGRRTINSRFGFGMDSFFWTFVMEMLIFTVGGIAVYEGSEKLRRSQPLGHVPLILGVLALSFAFEALAFLASWRESERGRPELSRRRHRRVSLVQFIHFSPQPGVFEVLDESIASLLGLVLATIGVIGTAVFGAGRMALPLSPSASC